MAFPLKIEIDLPTPGVHPDEPGWAYEHRFTAPDRDYAIRTTDGGTPTIWRDPARNAILLMPAQLSPGFATSDGGLFQRPRLASYHKDDGSVSSDWDEVRRLFDGDYFLQAKTVNQRLNSIKQYPANQALFLRCFAFSWGGDRETWFELEWGKAAVSTNDVAQFKIGVRFDGSFVLEKDGASVFSGYFAPEGVDRMTLPQRYFELMILPFRRNEILFWTNQGAYPVYVDPAIDPLQPNAGDFDGEGYGGVPTDGFVITKYGHAAIRFPVSKGYFQLTPVSYLSDSSGIGILGNDPSPVNLPYAPDKSRWLEDVSERMEIDKDQNADAGILASMTSGLDLDGVDDRMVWTMALRGHRPDASGFPTQCDATPVVYGFSYSLPTVAASGNDAAIDLADHIKSLTRSYDENGSSCRLEFKDPMLLDPSGSYRAALNRVIRIYQMDGAGNENELFYGIATEPEYEEWPDGFDGADHAPVAFRCEDFWHRFGSGQLTNFQALDGMKLSDAAKAILDKLGWPEDRRDIDDSDILLPINGKGEEKLLSPDQTGTAKEFLLRLRDAYTTADVPPYRWVMDFAPVLKDGAYKICFRFKNPENFPDVESGGRTRAWYGARADAEAASASEDDLARSYRRRVMEPEANWIAVIGESPNGDPLMKIAEDKESQDPSLALGSRPLNWIGERREVVYLNPTLNTDARVNVALSSLKSRLMSPRIVAEWEGESSYDDALWSIHEMNHDGGRRYSLVSMEIEHRLETEEKVRRTCRYSGEARA